jgi:acetyl-CoA acetyltransferase
MRPAYVHGVAVLTGWADATMNLGEFIFAGVTAALADAGRGMDAMDSVVLASHDLVDGRSLSSMVTAPPAGAYFRDEIRLSEDGLAAASLAAARIESGESDWSVVAAWGRASEGDYRRVSRTSFDPFLVQPLGLDDLSISSLRMNAWLARHADDRTAARTVRQARAAANPRRFGGPTARTELGHPFAPDDEPGICDMMVAAILGSSASSIRIAGCGHGTDTAAPTDRDLPAMTPLLQAARQAGAIGRAFDLYELDGATLGDEAMAIEAVGAAPAGGGFDAIARDPRFNPSGGSAAGWAFPANGLRRFAEANLQMRGDAGGVQLRQRPRSALVSGVSPVGGQVVTAMVLEAI